MSLFKPEDFGYDSHEFEGRKFIRIEYAANRANAKLEREGIEITGVSNGRDWLATPVRPTHKALLINIEPIAKCEHPRERIQPQYVTQTNTGQSKVVYKCECGARIEPESFKEVK